MGEGDALFFSFPLVLLCGQTAEWYFYRGKQLYFPCLLLLLPFDSWEIFLQSSAALYFSACLVVCDVFTWQTKIEEREGIDVKRFMVGFASWCFIQASGHR